MYTKKKHFPTKITVISALCRILNILTKFDCSVADPNNADAYPDPDSSYQSNAVSDPDTDPTFHFYADSDPDPTFHYDADPDPAPDSSDANL
jgi:hypothetical protein